MAEYYVIWYNYTGKRYETWSTTLDNAMKVAKQKRQQTVTVKVAMIDMDKEIGIVWERTSRGWVKQPYRNQQVWK